MKTGDFLPNSFNVEINDYRIEDVAEKVGFLLFGKIGGAIGKAVDDKTKNKTIKIGTKKDE